ncbi:hypothetical protein HPG69_009502 [Diceros bicornis minor]|uniref:Uncharacterized protein n=1 Tax=Diceros bicornis minor TaxID=77932 RepID=A0A7J7F3L4_DICBM|nr:hypothetical protein HPG69_009502 [Diceros bicornis minor]
MVSMGYAWEEIQDSSMNQKYGKVMTTYVLPGYKRSEPQGYTITLKPLPSDDPTKSCTPSPPCKVPYTVSANPKQWSFNEKATIPSTDPQSGPVTSPSTHNTSSHVGAPDRTNFPQGISSEGHSLHSGQLGQVQNWWNLPEGVTPSPSSGNSQGWQGATGRFFIFISHL